MEDLKTARTAGGRYAERLRRAHIAGVSGESAAADLHPQPMPGPESVGGGEQLDRDAEHTIGPGFDIGRF